MEPPKRTRARTFRKAPPLTERLLWRLLRDRRLTSVKFRRQVPIGPYVADFLCFDRRLIVEADGPHHDPEKDAARDAWFRTQGFRTLRFTNAEVQTNAYDRGCAGKTRTNPLSPCGRRCQRS